MFINWGVWNIHGLFTNVNNFKLSKIEDPGFKKRLKLFEILCLRETQCGPSDTKSLYLQGYRLFPYHRKISGNNRYYGGTLIIVKCEIRSGIKIIGNLHGDKIWIKLKKYFFHFERDIFVCFTYAPPHTSPYTKNTLTMTFSKNWRQTSLALLMMEILLLRGILMLKLRLRVTTYLIRRTTILP